MISQTSHFIELANKDKIHLRQITESNDGPSVLFMHGAIENGRIFYTNSNKGLAPFLASNGFNCFVADLRGRGLSVPTISAKSKTGQHDSIVEEIPAMFDFIKKQTGSNISHLCAHSWGGVLLNSVLARFPELRESVKSMVYFGSKRSLYNNHPYKLFQVNIVWYFLSVLLVKKYGYLPAKKFKFGADDETALSHKEGVDWVKKNPWIDKQDGFDYGEVLQSTELPATLHIAAINDKALAQKVDIEAFIAESGIGKQVLSMYGLKFGHSLNYDHINMLTHEKAKIDIFGDVLDWFKGHK